MIDLVSICRQKIQICRGSNKSVDAMAVFCGTCDIIPFVNFFYFLMFRKCLIHIPILYKFNNLSPLII